jgi:hypothetical protein
MMFAAALAAGTIVGCAGSDSDSNAQTASDRVQVRQQNDQTAHDLLREAQQSERNGNYAHALEVYTYLHGFPASSRPKDLDQRIKRDEAKMGDNRDR